MDMRKPFLIALIASMAPLIASAAGPEAVVRVESPAGNLWRSWGCPLNGSLIEWAEIGPHVDEWTALMRKHNYGYQPALPSCEDTLAVCKGKPSGRVIVQSYGPNRQPPGTEPDGPWAPQIWSSVIRTTC